MFELQNKVVMLTGANAGLTESLIDRLYDSGVSLVLASKDLDKLRDNVELKGYDLKRVLCVKVDVTDPESVASLVDMAKQSFGKIDALITFSGVQVRKPALDFTLEEWQRVMDVNLTGSFLCAQAVARQMVQQQSGKIIFVSSLTAEIGLPNMAAYVASKGGIRQLTKALAVEWATHGIAVNCVGPGRFRTPMTEDIFADSALKDKFLGCIPQNRPGIPDDLVGICLFLCSSLSDYFTGQSFYPDGGWLAGGGNAKG